VGRPQTESEGCGQRGEEDVVGGEVRHRVRERVEREPARLRVHHDLGQAGRARRGVQVPQLVGADASFPAVTRRGGRFAQQRARAAVLDEVGDLAFAGAGADADRHDPRLFAREHRRVHAGPVGDLERDAIAGREFVERPGHQRRARVVLAPGHRLARRGLDEGHAVGLRPGVAGYDLRNGSHGRPTLREVGDGRARTRSAT
jgi:hypothetical protein